MWSHAVLLLATVISIFSWAQTAHQEANKDSPFDLGEIDHQLDVAAIGIVNMPTIRYLGKLTREDVESQVVERLGVPSMRKWYKLLKENPDLDPSAVSSIVENLTDEHLDVMQPKACALLLEFLELFRTIPDANRECRVQFMLNMRNSRPRTIGAIPPSWMIKDGYLLVRSLVKTSPRALFYLQKATLVELGKNPLNACSLINVPDLMEHGRFFREWNRSECMAAMQKLAKTDLSAKFILSQPVNIFSHYAGPLTKATMKNMPGKYLSNLGSMAQGPICVNLKVEVVPEYLDYISSACLKEHLKRDIRMGEELRLLRPELINQYKTFLPDSLENLIRTENYRYLPKELRLKIISDNDLYEIFCKTEERAVLRELRLTSREFCSLGSKAIRWLALVRERLPDTFLARCEPQALEKVLENPASWNILARNNPNIVRQLTSKTKWHYCSMLRMQAYKSNLVLRRFGGDACRKALRFEKTEEAIRELPELVPLDNIPQHMIKASLEWWGGKGAILGMILVETLADWLPSAESLSFMHPDLLFLIDGSIAWYYRDFINAENAVSLGVDAFVNFFTFKGLELASLKWRQISMISGKAFDAFCKGDIEKLNVGQLCAINSDQWHHFGSKIQELSGEYLQLIDNNIVVKLAEFITPDIVPMLSDTAFWKFTKNEFKHLKLTDLRRDQIKFLSFGVPAQENALWNSVSTDRSLVLKVPNMELLSEAQSNRQISLNILHWLQKDMELLIPQVSGAKDKLEVGMIFLKKCSGIAQLEYFDKEEIGALIKKFMSHFTKHEKRDLFARCETLAPKVKVLFVTDPSLLLRSFDFLSSKWGVVISNDGARFDLADSVRKIKSQVHSIAFPQTTIVPRNPIDVEDPLKLWIEQTLKKIRDKCTTMISKSGQSKFSWLLDRNDGLVVGLLFGKVIQFGLKLPFILDPSFYTLIGEPKDGQIEEYFESTFAQEMTDYKNEFLGQRYGENGFSFLRNGVVIDPAKLCFSSLEGSMPNLTDFKKEDGVLVSFYSYETIISEYFDRELKPRILDEFKAFVHRFNGGLDQVLSLKRLCACSSERLQEIFSRLLGDQQFDLVLPIAERMLIKPITSLFEGSQLVAK